MLGFRLARFEWADVFPLSYAVLGEYHRLSAQRVVWMILVEQSLRTLGKLRTSGLLCTVLAVGQQEKE